MHVDENMKVEVVNTSELKVASYNVESLKKQAYFTRRVANQRIGILAF